MDYLQLSRVARQNEARYASWVVRVTESVSESLKNHISFIFQPILFILSPNLLIFNKEQITEKVFCPETSLKRDIFQKGVKTTFLRAPDFCVILATYLMDIQWKKITKKGKMSVWEASETARKAIFPYPPPRASHEFARHRMALTLAAFTTTKSLSHRAIFILCRT